MGQQLLKFSPMTLKHFNVHGASRIYRNCDQMEQNITICELISRKQNIYCNKDTLTWENAALHVITVGMYQA